MSNKTLIGKNNYLFLTNDSCNELEIHCNNKNLVNNINLPQYKFDKFIIVVFPNKSYIYKKYLPEKYDAKYRPAIQIYKNKLENKIMDGYELLKNEDDVYYKTDTHINLKGNYIIYKNFVKKINELYNLNLTAKNVILQNKTCKLNELKYGIGDLTWKINLGDQILDDINDTYYFSDDISDFYNVYEIKNNSDIRFLTYELCDKTNFLEEQNDFARWDVISKYIIYKKNIDKCDTQLKVIIFYDSFLLNILPLYFDLFYEVYLIKSVYDNALINLIKPCYVFEFRVERFLF